MKILVCGSRTWTDRARINARLDALRAEHPDMTIIHGAAAGADMMAHSYALTRHVNVEAYPADWETHGRAAGPIRNLAMLDQNPDLVLAFQRNGSRGTQHTIDEARKRGIPVEVYEG